MKTRRTATQGRPEHQTLDGPLRGPIRRTVTQGRPVLFTFHTLDCHTWTAQRIATRGRRDFPKYMQNRHTETAPN
jgi:hypothetical protein